MSDAYVGEIRLFAGSYAPDGWHLCDGTVLTVQGNEALFSLIGATYGGNGSTNFALPDLRGRVPIHMGQGTGLTNRAIGQTGGAETVALTTAQLPTHTHNLVASSSPATSTTPGGTLGLATTTTSGWGLYYAGNTPTADVQIAPMASTAVGVTGNSQPHANMMPSLVLTYIICLLGTYPTRS